MLFSSLFIIMDFQMHFSKAWFLNYNASDILGHVNICYGDCPVHCRIFSGIPRPVPSGYANRPSHHQLRITAVKNDHLGNYESLFYPTLLYYFWFRNLVKTIDFRTTLNSQCQQSLASDHGQVTYLPCA